MQVCRSMFGVGHRIAMHDGDGGRDRVPGPLSNGGELAPVS